MKAAFSGARRLFADHVSPAAGWRAAMRFQSDNMGDRAAGLSYYAMLALFPGLLVVLTLLGILGGDKLVDDLVTFAEDQGASEATADVVKSVATRATSVSSGTLSLTLLVSLVLAINGASGVFGAAGRAINAAHGVGDDERGFVHRRFVVYGLTLLSSVLLMLSIALVFLGGQWARDIFDRIGLGGEAATVWEIVRWPIALTLALAALAVVVRYAPAESARRRSPVTTGALVTVVLWVLATLGFSFYVKNFGNYGALYGAFSAAVILLLWLYLMAMSFLYGAELDGELRRRRLAQRTFAADIEPGAT